MVSPNLIPWIENDSLRVPKVLERMSYMSVYSYRLKYNFVYFSFTSLKTLR